MNGLVFETQAVAIASAPNRVDIACFIGFVARQQEVVEGSLQPTLVPSAIQRWLRQQGWTQSAYARPEAEGDRATLVNIPVPIDSWESFAHLFAWEARPVDTQSGASLPTPLGVAVQTFFAQGGRKCYVVAVGEPWPLLEFFDDSGDRQAQIQNRLQALIPGYPISVSGSAHDPGGWQGVTHLLGLTDVAFVCLPDIVEAIAPERTPLDIGRLQSESAEIFVECSEVLEPDTPLDQGLSALSAPRADETAYQQWAEAVALIASFIANQRLELQYVVAVPLPAEGERLEPHLSELRQRLQTGRSGLGRTAATFIQLAYPWVRSLASTRLPEQLESPDGVLVGILARSALTRGAFRSIVRLAPIAVSGVVPVLTRSQRSLPLPATPEAELSLIQQVSLIGPTPSGIQVLSDTTFDPQETYRPASIHRLISLIIRALRQMGQDHVFEPSSSALWGQVRSQLTLLLTSLWTAGALRGASAAEAFQVRCDRSTMTQTDIENGRVIAVVQFAPAAPIEQITIALSLAEGSQVSVLSATPLAQEVA